LTIKVGFRIKKKAFDLPNFVSVVVYTISRTKEIASRTKEIASRTKEIILVFSAKIILSVVRGV
jgi:hypothetical protein